jgi:protein-S-isoprenylcysteine O-methyltransferase Ste14
MIFVVAGRDHRFHAATLPAWLEIAADILVALGFYITHLTLRENSHAAGTIRVEEGQTVTSTGPYAWVRHPMYAGASLLLLATPVALGSVRALVPAVVVVVLIALRLLREERFLKANLPGYEDYCRKVRWRLVPGLW